MPVGPLQVSSPFLTELLSGQLSSLTGGPVSAILLNDAFLPDLVNDIFYSQIATSEVTGGDYMPAALTGASMTVIADGARFLTDDVSFGNPVHIPYCRYMALLVGAIPLQPGARVIGIVDLATDAVAIQSINGEFTVAAPATGWFEVLRS